MFKYSFFATAFFIATLFSCNDNKQSPNHNNDTKTTQESKVENDIPFNEAKNYFVKNTYKDSVLHTNILKSQVDFDNIFGMATTMGNDGKPTVIDFTNQYAIAVICPNSDKSPVLNILNVKSADNSITLHYKFTEGEKQSFSIRPFKIILLDNKYQGEVKLQKD
jgi:hypothetical protein